MPEDSGPDNLEGVVDQIAAAAEENSDEVSVGDILDRIGQRSFGPMLIVPALIAFTPLGGLPGLPTLLAALVILVIVQIVIGLQGIWVPGVVRRRSVEPQRLQSSLKYIRPVARAVDKVLRPRLAWLTRPPFVYLAAALGIAVALTVPPLEVVPFGGTPSWAAIAALGLALIAHDGVLMLVALAFAGGGLYLVVAMLM